MNLTPRELLQALESAALAGEPLPDAVTGWLCASLRRYRHGLDLSAALGLTGTEARRHRDAALRRAAELLAPDEDRRAAARILSRHLDHYERAVAPEVRRHPDRLLTGWKLELHRAHLTGCTIPRTARHLAEILNDKVPDIDP